MRRAAPRAQRPVVTTNVHFLCRARLGVVAAQRATKLERAKTELVAKLVGGLGEPFEFFVAVGFEQVQLFCTMRETGEGHTEKADLALRFAMFAEQFKKNRKNIGVEPDGFLQGTRTGIGLKSRIANRQGQGA